MNRSLWKIKDFIKNKKNYKQIWNRNIIINSNDIGYIYKIHNGCSFVSRYIEKLLIGYKFGELSITRKFTNKFKKIKQKLLSRKKIKK